MLHGYNLLKCSNASCIFKRIIIYMSSVVAPHLLSTMLQSKRPRAAGTGHSRATGTQTATQRDTARRHQLEPRVQAGRGLRRLPPLHQQAPQSQLWLSAARPGILYTLTALVYVSGRLCHPFLTALVYVTQTALVYVALRESRALAET